MERIHFPIVRRQDKDIPSLEEVSSFPCKYTRLKYLICALRRGRKEYWNLFDNLVRENADEFSKRLKARWIVSICDTYIDYGEAEDAAAGIAISSLNFYATLSAAIYHGQSKTDPKKKAVGVICSVPYCTSFVFEEKTDFFENYIKRLYATVSRSPTLFLLAKSFMGQQMNDKESLIGYTLGLNNEKLPKQTFGN